MRTKLHFFLALSCCSLLAGPARAQLSQAKSQFDRLKGAVGEVAADREESRLESTAATVETAANAMAGALVDLGARLAAASGSFGTERSAVAGMAGAVRNSLGALAKNARGLGDHIRSKGRWPPDDYKRELVNRCQDVRMEYERDAKEWEALARKVDDTRRWLQDRLAEAASMRDNAAKPAEALEQNEEQISTRIAELSERFNAAFQSWWGVSMRYNQSRARENEAFRAWQAAIKAAEGNQFGERVKALASTWLAAEEEQIAAARAEFEASMALDRIAEDRRKMSSELARALTELRAFARDATSDTINKRWAEFDLWTREYEREIAR